MRRVSLPAAPFTKIGVQAPLDHAVRPWADLPSGQPTRSASQGSSPTGVPSPGVARPANPLPHESAVLGGARARRRPRAQGPQVMKPRWRHCLFQQSAGFRRRHTGPDSGHQEVTKASALHLLAPQTRPFGAWCTQPPQPTGGATLARLHRTACLGAKPLLQPLELHARHHICHLDRSALLGPDPLDHQIRYEI